MLHHLHIRNLAVLSETSVDFGTGLNVLTGETGAGKSIVVDSLSLLAGARAQIDLIRTGADVLRVTGVFSCGLGATAEQLLESGVEVDGDELVVRREIHRSGRNQVFINDQPVTLKLLARIAPQILRIHGQREELGLAHPKLQRVWLDRQGGERGAKLLEECQADFRAWHELAARLERATGNHRLRDERIDLLTYQLGEIDAAQLEAGEEDEARAERGVLRNAEGISTSLAAIRDLLFEDDGSATERLAKACAHLGDIAAWEPKSGEWMTELEEARIRLEEVVSAVRERADRVEPDPQRLQSIENRLAEVERLCHKYGPTTAEVLAYREQASEEMDGLRLDDDQQSELEKQVAHALEEYSRTAKELSQRRQEWSQRFVEALETELEELSMPAARFEIRLERRARSDSPLRVDNEAVDFGPDGFDRVSYYFSPNPGEELRPLAKVASGGELSRVYLAIQLQAQQLQAQGASLPTLVFDEVDSGVGGVEASALGRKLKHLARAGQILTVTHLPQVASQGDLHFKVDKDVRDGRTFVSIGKLDHGTRVAEISRMLGGETASQASRSHAEALLVEGAATTVAPA